MVKIWSERKSYVVRPQLNLREIPENVPSEFRMLIAFPSGSKELLSNGMTGFSRGKVPLIDSPRKTERDSF
jgi:hypothetical protein